MTNEFENDCFETGSLNTYIREINNIPLLSRDEEYELAVKAQAGDSKAREKLITANSRFVISIAKKFQGRGLQLEDLISEGNVGLIMAVDKFQPEKGFHFISYAVWWIRQSILKAINDKSRLIRLPMNKCADFSHIYDAKSKLENNGDNASVEDIAKACGLDQQQVKEILNFSREVVSLDSPIGTDEDTSVGDMMESQIPGPEEEVIENSLHEAINNILSSYSPKERDIIIKRFGLMNNKPLSLQEVGTLYGLTKERIRQIEKKVLFSMKNNEESKHLKEYLA